MKTIPAICILMLFQLSTSAQFTKDSTSKNVAYYSREIDHRYIIELSSRPVSIRNIEKICKTQYSQGSRGYKVLREKLIKDGVSQIKNEQNEFLSAFNKIRIISSGQAGFRNKILRHYESALNGFAMDADSITIKEIRKIRNVRRVVKDRIIKINDDSSNELIGAPTVWQQTGATGKGILIGILDTGIDPNLPEFTGRVLRGYDFVNEDTIPFDDHGHGTHCAGIAAANGPNLKGVAPRATILPIKVMDAGGYGSWSAIIAGVNYAIDPDQNPLTNDGVRILSISLGGPGFPDDPLAQAIDNAFEKNVLCVVAAGNSGNNYYDIGSPGCAEKAFTIGASDHNDVLATFSSCGPVMGTFQAKPDVLAPGVDIYSTLPNGLYASWSGTSMATPHVAGAAALLMELHPDWSPADVKAAIMQSAKDIGENIWKQGKGRLDLVKSLRVKTTINPCVISFGLIDETSNNWSKFQSIKIHNLSGSAKTYKLSLKEGLPAGITLSYPASVMVVDTVTIPVTISINQQVYQFPNTVPSFYQGKLLVTSSLSDSTYVPLLVNSAQYVKIIFDKIPNALFIRNTDGFEALYSPNDTVFSFIVDNPGEYGLIAGFDGFNTYVVHEKELLTNHRIVTMSSTEAKNELTGSAVDQNGELLPIFDGYTEGVFFKGTLSGMRVFRIMFFFEENSNMQVIRKINNISDNIQFDFEALSIPAWNKSKKLYFFPYEFSNLSESKVVTNSKNDFLGITRKFPANYAKSNMYLNYNFFTIGLGGCNNINFKEMKLDVGNTYKDYVLPFPSRDYKLRGISFYGIREFNGDPLMSYNDSMRFMTGNEVYPIKGTYTAGNEWFDQFDQLLTSDSLSFHYGLMPTHYTPMFSFSQDKLSISHEGQMFFNASYDFIPGRIEYCLSFKNGKDSVGFVHNESYFKPSFDWGKNDYTINQEFTKIKFTYKAGKLDQQDCKSTATHYRNSTTFMPNRIRSFQFKGNEIVSDHLKPGNTNTIEVLTDYAKSIKLFANRKQEATWREIELKPSTENSLCWKGLFPNDITPGYYNIQLISSSEIDSLVYTVEPAFVIYEDSCKGQNPDHPVVSISSSIPLPDICQGQKILLTAGGADIYEWSTRDLSASITIDTAGKYKVVGRNLYGCKDSATIEIKMKPAYEIIHDVGICENQNYMGHTESGIYSLNYKTVCNCDSILTTNLTVHPVFSINKDITICNGENYKGHTATGTYVEKLMSAFGCDSIVNSNLQVINSDHCVTGTPVPVNEGIIKVYPNPAHEKIQIEFVKSADTQEEIKIYTYDGRLMFSKSYPIIHNIVQIDLGTYPAGIYILKFYTDSNVYQIKVIKD